MRKTIFLILLLSPLFCFAQDTITKITPQYKEQEEKELKGELPDVIRNYPISKNDVYALTYLGEDLLSQAKAIAIKLQSNSANIKKLETIHRDTLFLEGHIRGISTLLTAELKHAKEKQISDSAIKIVKDYIESTLTISYPSLEFYEKVLVNEKNDSIAKEIELLIRNYKISEKLLKAMKEQLENYFNSQTNGKNIP